AGVQRALPSDGVRGVPQYCSIKCKGPLKLADLDRPVKGCQIRLFDSLSNGDSHVSELAFFLIEPYWGTPQYGSNKSKGHVTLTSFDKPAKGRQTCPFDSLSSGDRLVSQLRFSLFEPYWGVPQYGSNKSKGHVTLTSFDKPAKGRQTCPF